jgi:hypothetical protein
MKITHANGNEVETNVLPDVDAILMEKSKELHELFASYNRQLMLVGEMKPKADISSEQGCVFFHVAKIDAPQEIINEAFGKFWWRLNGFTLNLSNGNLYIAKNQKPE